MENQAVLFSIARLFDEAGSILLTAADNLDGDAAALADTLTEDSVLVHMSGHTQPRAAWLEEVERGSMAYHRIEVVGMEVATEGGEAVVTARTRTEATIWGSRATWPLQLVSRLRHMPDGAWRIARSVASTW